MRPILFAAALLIGFCAVYFGGKLIGFDMTEYSRWTGHSADGNWEAVMKKAVVRPGSAEILLDRLQPAG